jgi:hypothetical protein
MIPKKPKTKTHNPLSSTPKPVSFIIVFFSNALATIEPITARATPIPIAHTLKNNILGLALILAVSSWLKRIFSVVAVVANIPKMLVAIPVSSRLKPV